MEDKNLKELQKEMQCLTPEEVARLFDIHKERVYLFCRKGILPAFKLNNGIWRIPLYKLKEFIEDRINQPKKVNKETEGTDRDTDNKTTDIKGLKWNQQTRRYEIVAGTKV
ncbi:MAG: helix-turn-helix domain-containing protein [Nitrospiraceae bacterium]|nr:helix-turn-helix domain-containing protein [Nitrospiraceae bacterium]